MSDTVPSSDNQATQETNTTPPLLDVVNQPNITEDIRSARTEDVLRPMELALKTIEVDPQVGPWNIRISSFTSEANYSQVQAIIPVRAFPELSSPSMQLTIAVRMHKEGKVEISCSSETSMTAQALHKIDLGPQKKEWLSWEESFFENKETFRYETQPADFANIFNDISRVMFSKAQESAKLVRILGTWSADIPRSVEEQLAESESAAMDVLDKPDEHDE